MPYFYNLGERPSSEFQVKIISKWLQSEHFYLLVIKEFFY